MFWLGCAFALGVLAEPVTNLSPPLVFSIAAITAIAALILRRKASGTAAIMIAFIAAGIASAHLEKAGVAPDRIKALYDSGAIPSNSPVEVEGILLSPPEITPEGTIMTLRVDRIAYRGSERTARGTVRLSTASDISEIDLRYGSRIRAASALSRDEQFLDPGVLPRREMLDRLGVDASGTIKSPLLIEKLADESVFLPIAWVYERRAQLISDIAANTDRQTAGIMIASLLGNKYFLDKRTADLFREGGTFHVLVISGLHITFIGGLLLLFIRLFTRNRWIQFFFTCGSLWVYTLAVGADVPVVRAAIMFTVLSFSPLVYRTGNLINSLGFCGLVLVAWRPSDVYNPSLQLTFVSVSAIAGAAYPLIEMLRRLGRWTPTANTPFPPIAPAWLVRFCETLYWVPLAWEIESERQIWSGGIIKRPFFAGQLSGWKQKTVRYVFEGLLVSAVVQIAMLPLSVVYFHRVSIASVLLNLWVGLFMAIESFAVVAGVLLSHVSGILASFFLTFGEICNSLLISVPRLVADGGWASFRLPSYSGTASLVYIVYFISVIALAIMLNRWQPFEVAGSARNLKRIIAAHLISMLVLIVVIVLHPFSSARPDGRLHIDFLDVGQGDSALLTFPDGKTMLVDGGGRIDLKKAHADEDGEPFERDVRDIGDAVVSEFLWYRGLSRVDYVIATHADADHIQGLGDVAKNFSVGEAFVGRSPADDPEYAIFSDVLRRRQIRMTTLRLGERFTIGGCLVEVIYPPEAANDKEPSDNNHSVALMISFGSRRFLLTGDIEREAESALTASGADLSADVVKVAHHGSRTSSIQPLVDAASPAFAVISVGRTSPFGHPHREVVERWQQNGARVMRTGEKGMISFSTNGEDLTVSTFLK